MKGFPTDMKPTEMVQWALDAAAAFKSVQQALKLKKPEPSKNDGAVSEIDGVTKNPDGTVTIRRSFSLDPQVVAENSHPAAQKTAPSDPKAAHVRGPVSAADEAVACCDGKGHDTPLENCKAKYPMACPYHGIKAMEKTFLTYLQYYGLAKDGGSVPYAITKKPSGAFQISVSCPEMYAKGAENAINDFLKQAGFKGVDALSETPSATAGQSDVSQAFKQDMAKAPDDMSMLQEWQEALLDDEEMLGSDKHLELLSMLAELDGVNPSEMTEAQQKLLSQAQEAYHQLKAESDFKDIASEEAAYAAASEMTQACDEALAKAKKLHDDVWVAKKKVGFSSSPKGFPGNQDYNDAYYKMFPLNHSSQKEMYDSGKVELANEALVDALTAGDFDKAKKALYDLAYAKDLAERHSAAFAQHAEAMKQNFAKFQDTGLDADAIAHNSFKKNQAIFAAHGLAYPEELQKEIDEAVETAKKSVSPQPIPASVEETSSDAVKVAPSKAKSKKAKADGAVANTGEMNFPKGMDNMPPLVHDESKFPQNLTMAALDEALLGGEKAGGGGGLGTMVVTIHGKKYICKAGTDKDKKTIENGYACDMAYRAGGIHAPDAKLYTFGNKVYKLAEFIEGTRLDKLVSSKKGSRWEVPQSVKDELLKGYPLDVLFSNWDVLGTNEGSGLRYTNVIVDKDGHCWRVDNDGSFGVTGIGGEKNLQRARQAYCEKDKNGKFKKEGDNYVFKTCAFEMWDEHGGWSKRKWIDDYRTMRVDAMNNGVFDQYTTHQIFDAASRIDFHNAIIGLPTDIKGALAKPVAEMREMVAHAKGTNVAGYKMGTTYQCGENTISVDPISIALDSLYDAAKLGAREPLQHDISWDKKGWINGSQEQSYVKKSYDTIVKKPEKPELPKAGEDYALSILEGVKTINYHVDEGNFTPNPTRIAKAIGCKSALEAMVSKDGNEKAKALLGIIKRIEDAKANGYTEKLTFDTPDGFMDVKGLSLVSNKDELDAAKKNNKAAWDKYNKDLAAWQKQEEIHNAEEDKKAKAAGAAPETTFIEFMSKFISDNYDTNGVKQGGGHPEVNKESKDGQKGTSWKVSSAKKKVRQYAMMGIGLDEMLGWKDNDKTFYNGYGKNHVSGGGKDGKKFGFHPAIMYYKSHPSEFKKDMEAYARHKALLYLAHYHVKNPAIDHETNTIWAQRAEHSDVCNKFNLTSHGNGIIPYYPIDCSTSAQINGTGTLGQYSIGFKLPMWRITDNWLVGDEGESEKEICINPIRIPYPPMYCAGFGSWQQAMKSYNALPQVKAIDQKMKSIFS